VLLFDSSLTLVNAQGTGITFTFGYTHDTEVPNGHHSFNDHESVDALRADVAAHCCRRVGTRDPERTIRLQGSSRRGLTHSPPEED